MKEIKLIIIAENGNIIFEGTTKDNYDAYINGKKWDLEKHKDSIIVYLKGDK